MIVVYKITCVVTGRVYIGSTINYNKRRNLHLSSLRRGTSHCIKLQRAFNKYGEKCFIFEVIECVLGLEDLHLRESFWINEFDSIRAGLNIAKDTKIPMLGRKHSDETKQLMSKNSPHHKGALGKIRSVETKARQSKAYHETDYMVHLKRSFAQSIARRGKKNWSTKLNETQVKEIRSNNDLSQNKIAIKYGISQTTVWKIKKRVKWAWLD